MSEAESFRSDVDDRPIEAKPLPFCLNCGVPKPDSDAFCKNCGQRHTRVNEGLGYFVRDFITSFLSLDGRAFRTVTTLLFNPGKCAKDFLNGRRTHYLSTAQTYLVSGFFFFLVFGNWIDVVQIEQLFTVNLDQDTVSISDLNRGSIGSKELDSQDTPEASLPKSDTLAPNQKSEPQANVDQGNDKLESTPPPTDQDSETPSTSAAEDSKRETFLNKVHKLTYNGKPLQLSFAEFRQFSMLPKEEVRQVFLDQGIELGSWEINIIKNLALMTTDHGFRSYVSGSVSLASQLALLMLPLMAVLIRVLHWRSCRTWLAAFVVSANWHTSMYLVLIVVMLLNLSLWWVMLSGIALGAILLAGDLAPSVWPGVAGHPNQVFFPVADVCFWAFLGFCSGGHWVNFYVLAGVFGLIVCF
ncbi:MAG: DUF3667 domain-containing protein [Pirellulaceae bacterium]|nr:DUF3667 domain-containing protein [Pirellulaceae bacterium]